MRGSGSQGVRPWHVVAFLAMIAVLAAADVLIERFRPPLWVGGVLLTPALLVMWRSAVRAPAQADGVQGSLWARSLALAADPGFVLFFVPFMAAQKVFEQFYGWFAALLIVVALCAPLAVWAHLRRSRRSGQDGVEPAFDNQDQPDDQDRSDAEEVSSAGAGDVTPSSRTGVGADEGPRTVVEFDRGSVHPGDGNIPTSFELPAAATLVDLLIAMSEASGTVLMQLVGGCRWLVEQILDDGGRRLLGTVDYFDDWRQSPVVGVCYGSPYEPVPLGELLGPSIRLEATHVYAKEVGIIKADRRGYTGAGIVATNYDW